MSALDEISSSLTGGARVIMISERDVDLRPGLASNRLVLLRIAEGSLAAGGRGGGYGERRVVSVSIFESLGGEWKKAFQTEEEATAAKFEVPYYVSRIPFFLPDGTEGMGYGVVEPELVESMVRLSRASPA